MMLFVCCMQVSDIGGEMKDPATFHSAEINQESVGSAFLEYWGEMKGQTNEYSVHVGTRSDERPQRVCLCISKA